jgi:hypothetical protein
MGLAQAIPVELAFTGAQSLVLFRHPLPQRFFISSPPLEVQVEILEDRSPSAGRESEGFSYDRKGFMDRKEKKGQLLDSYC